MKSGSARQWSVFYAYTAWSVVVMMAVYPLGAALILDLGIPALASAAPVAAASLLVQMVLSAWSAHRAMAAWSAAEPSGDRDRWDLPRVGSLPSDPTLAAAAAPSAVIALLQLPGGGERPVLVLSLSLLAAATLVRWPWRVGVAGTLVYAAVTALLGRSLGETISLAVLLLVIVLSIRLSLWLAAMVRELDAARDAQAQLAVAEERLRFARDLHDVTGRDLSVIAVKSELVAQLAEREDPRAVEHGREVAQIARTSLAEIRELVRGYREADLGTELRGTAALLRSAGAEVTLHGSAEDVPTRRAGTTAWVLREGGTNILRHAEATAVTIALSPEGVRLVNDGAPGVGPVPEGSGLTGMRERLGDGAVLTVSREDGRFILDVRFDPVGEPR